MKPAARLAVGFDLDMTLIDTVPGFAPTLEALGALLIEREVIDREALDGLMATGDSTTRIPSATAAAAGELGISTT